MRERPGCGMPSFMGKDATRTSGLESILDQALRGELSEADARRLYALGPETAVKVPLPEKPQKVNLDPDFWILSEKTSVKQVKR